LPARSGGMPRVMEAGLDLAGYKSRRVLSRHAGTVAFVLALAVLPIAAPAQAADLSGHRASRHDATKYTYPPQPRYAESYFPADQYDDASQPGYSEYAPVDSRPVHRSVMREYRVVVVRDPPIPTKTFPRVGYGPMAYGQVVDPVQAVVETRRYRETILRYEGRAVDSGATVVPRW
jgi:hypothetical protein